MAANTVQSSSALSDEARLAMMADERRGLMAQAHRAQQASESSLGLTFPPLHSLCVFIVFTIQDLSRRDALDNIEYYEQDGASWRNDIELLERALESGAVASVWRAAAQTLRGHGRHMLDEVFVVYPRMYPCVDR